MQLLLKIIWLRYYIGSDMKTARTELGITYITMPLDKSRVPKKEKEEVLTIIDGFKRDIVEK